MINEALEGIKIAVTRASECVTAAIGISTHRPTLSSTADEREKLGG